MSRFRFKKPPSLLIYLLLLVLFVILLVPKFMQIHALKKRSENLEVELQKLQRENQALETELRLLLSDPLYVEKVARQKFNKAREGEIVYKVVRPSETSQKN